MYLSMYVICKAQIHFISNLLGHIYALGVQVRNMKMVFNISVLGLYNEMLKIFHRRDDFYILLYKATK